MIRDLPDVPEPGPDTAARVEAGLWRTQGLPCVQCASPLSGFAAAIDEDDSGPQPGALCVCSYCGTPQLLEDSMVGWRMRPLTPHERAGLDEQERAVVAETIRRAPLWRQLRAEGQDVPQRAQDGRP